MSLTSATEGRRRRGLRASWLRRRGGPASLFVPALKLSHAPRRRLCACAAHVTRASQAGAAREHMKLPPGHGAAPAGPEAYGGFGRAMLEKLGWSRCATNKERTPRCEGAAQRPGAEVCTCGTLTRASAPRSQRQGPGQERGRHGGGAEAEKEGRQRGGALPWPQQHVTASSRRLSCRTPSAACAPLLPRNTFVKLTLRARAACVSDWRRHLQAMEREAVGEVVCSGAQRLAWRQRRRRVRK